MAKKKSAESPLPERDTPPAVNVFELLEQVQEVALSFDNAEETMPWGTYAFCRELKGRGFLYANKKPDHLEVTFRLLPAEREKLLLLPFVEPGKFMAERGWLTARVRTPKELEQITPWFKLSYDLAKPFRTKEEALPGENPVPLDFLEQVREVASGFGNIEEYFPYGGRAFRPQKGQIFLYADAEEEYLYVAVRLPLGEREYALSLPYLEVPKYIGHKGWVAAQVRTPDELETVLPWITVSFEINNPPRTPRRRTQT